MTFPPSVSNTPSPSATLGGSTPTHTAHHEELRNAIVDIVSEITNNTAKLNTANTFTGAQLIRAAATQDAIEILGRAGGTSSFKATITPLALSASCTWSLPDRSDTFAGLKCNNFTEAQIIGTDPGGSELLRVGGAIKVLTASKIITSTSPDSFLQLDDGIDGVFLSSGGNIQFSSTSNITFTTNGTDRAIVNMDGSFVLGTDPGGSELLRVGGSVNIASGQGYKVAGIKVVGGQASAIADISTADATDLTSAIALANANKAKINTILAMLRTHGLIAT
jgi:hypothetical protein